VELWKSKHHGLTIANQNDPSYTAVNLYTYAVKTMASDSLDKHCEKILERLETIIVILEDLLEDPIFLDTIHGEQELSLDLALEVLDGIVVKFEPEAAPAPKGPAPVDDSYDAN
jgi:MinD-like ATPase involved in chromosome partitioning or flagellar assembly